MEQILERLLAGQEQIMERLEVKKEASQERLEAKVATNNEKLEALRGTLLSRMDIQQIRAQTIQEEMDVRRDYCGARESLQKPPPGGSIPYSDEERSPTRRRISAGICCRHRSLGPPCLCRISRTSRQ
jgi:hypothetical protein